MSTLPFSVAGAGVATPYTADAHTVLLYHFDEPSGSAAAADSSLSAKSAIPYTSNALASPPSYAANSDTFGFAGLDGFGTSASINHKQRGIGVDWNGNGSFETTADGATRTGATDSPDAVALSSLTAADGSFTIEALINVSTITGSNQEIVCTDDIATNALRAFQFRINSSGQLEFNLIGTNTSASAAAIPTTGDHAFVAGQWFHVALAFDGATNTSSFYWTRADAAPAEAHLIGTSTNETMDRSLTGVLVFGNEGRHNDGSNEGLLGLIDEVRVSNVRRAADEFVFNNEEDETPVVSQGVVAPYTADDSTVFLYHFDEEAGQVSAASTGSNASPAIAFTASGTTAGYATNTDTFGAAAYEGFGSSAEINSAFRGIGVDGNGNGILEMSSVGQSTVATTSADALPLSAITAEDGSFTMEALIQTSAITGFNQQILCTDDSGGNDYRAFQFRINTSGQLEFNIIGTNTSTSTVAIPTTGTHAFAPGEWFHVALAFDGATNTSSFYWTKVSALPVEANRIGTSSNETMNRTLTGVIVIGNEGRQFNGSNEGLRGSIDEVRFSNVVRQADEFLFSIDPVLLVDSDDDGLPDSWELQYFSSLEYDGEDDPDGDGFTNAEEYAAGTDPSNGRITPLDKDGDDLPDAWEIEHFGNITAQSGADDYDHDLATNWQEYEGGSDPKDALSWPDTDGDALNDGWEIHYFGDVSFTNGTLDSDGDGFTDKEEHDARTDPTDGAWSPVSAKLIHRWSFNGDLTDSAGGRTAVLVPGSGTGAATLNASSVVLGGGARSSAGYVDLGSGLIGDKINPVTIELWATPTAIQNWGRIFDIGVTTSEYLFMSWTQGTSSGSDRVSWVDGVGTTSNNTVAPYLLNTQYHIVMTIEPYAGVGGTTRVTWYAAAEGNPIMGEAKGTFDTSNTLVQFTDSVFWLGRSQWSGDATASAVYDEVRIWDGALTQTERERFHEFGPGHSSLADSDDDGLPDAWEMVHFGSLEYGANDDPDADDFTNLQEYEAGSNPNDRLSVPGDLDGDGLPDEWEIGYFGHLNYGPSDDPDGDGDTNATEYANGSAPNNRASHAGDFDADGLPDEWEEAHFGTLGYNGGDDPDGDGFSNLQEYVAGTLPNDAASRPSGTAVKLVPVDDGDPSTSEFGYAGNSAINTVAFVRSSLKTVGNQQFITWYGRHQYDAGAKYNNTIWIGRRTLGSAQWEVFRHPSFTANDITDGHDVISYGIDGDGYMHVSWGMHGDQFHYARSLAPVTGTAPIELGPDTTMTGQETTVTYPQFLKLPDGDLLFIFREFYSGDGETHINRYSIETKQWTSVHTNAAGGRAPLMTGRFGYLGTYDYNAYLNLPQLGGADGNELTFTWCWRYLPVNQGAYGSPTGNSGYQTNNMLNFARSRDAGLTWERFDGTPYSLPITRNAETGDQNSRAEVIVNIPEGSSLINQASTCLDGNGNPVTATWWAPETPSRDYRRQYMVVFRHDDGTWQTRTVSNRNTDAPGTLYNENYVRNLGRPIVVRDDDDRIIVAYRDNQGSNTLGIDNGLTIVHSLPKAQDPDRQLWITFDLTDDNLGNFEPIIDNEQWDEHRRLHFLYQASEGQGYTAESNLAARVSVLEWDAVKYFAHASAPSIKVENQTAILSFPTEPSWGYRLWTSTELVPDQWELVETFAGTGAVKTFEKAILPSEPKRFWRIESKEGGFEE